MYLKLNLIDVEFTACVSGSDLDGALESGSVSQEAQTLESELERDEADGYCFSKTSHSQGGCRERFKVTTSSPPNQILKSLNTYKVVYIMKID